jgi:hypothetical protein
MYNDGILRVDTKLFWESDPDFGISLIWKNHKQIMDCVYMQSPPEMDFDSVVKNGTEPILPLGDFELQSLPTPRAHPMGQEGNTSLQILMVSI